MPYLSAVHVCLVTLFALSAQPSYASISTEDWYSNKTLTSDMLDALHLHVFKDWHCKVDSEF